MYPSFEDQCVGGKNIVTAEKIQQIREEGREFKSSFGRVYKEGDVAVHALVCLGVEYDSIIENQDGTQTRHLNVTIVHFSLSDELDEFNSKYSKHPTETDRYISKESLS